MIDTVEINKDYRPGAIGRVIELHGEYYHAHWRFGEFFEAKVACELAEFFSGYDAERDGFWTAAVGGRVKGSIAIDGVHSADEGAHLRWFIVSDELRGRGIGTRLLHAAVDFCRVPATSFRVDSGTSSSTHEHSTMRRLDAGVLVMPVDVMRRVSAA